MRVRPCGNVPLLNKSTFSYTETTITVPLASTPTPSLSPLPNNILFPPFTASDVPLPLTEDKLVQEDPDVEDDDEWDFAGDWFNDNWKVHSGPDLDCIPRRIWTLVVTNVLTIMFGVMEHATRVVIDI